MTADWLYWLAGLVVFVLLVPYVLGPILDLLHTPVSNAADDRAGRSA